MAKTDSSSERLLNLVIALLNTSAPMTRSTIRSDVHGYHVNETDVAFSRMLERDKDTLRNLGVPIVTVGADGPADEVGYRIDTASYELRGVRLDAAQTAVLGLAAGLWRDKTLRTQTSRAVSKLRALGAVDEDRHGEAPAATDDLVSALAPRVRSGAESYDVLMGAITGRRRVTFSYRAAATGELLDRTVEPWRVAVRSGRWYLIGFDVDRQAPRVFHLARVARQVRAVGPEGAFPAPDHALVESTTAGLRDTASGGVARLAVLPERAGALRARRARHASGGAGPDGDGSRGEEPRGEGADGQLPEVAADTGSPGTVDGRDVIEVSYSYTPTFADEVAGYGDAVLVLDPADLRAAVLERLRAAAALAGARPDDDRAEEADRG